MRRWFGVLWVALSVGALGCDDEPGSTIIVEDIDGSALDPERPEPEPEPADPEDPEDPEVHDAGPPEDHDGRVDEGGSVEGDAGRDAGRPGAADAAAEPPPGADAGGGRGDAATLPGDDGYDPDPPVFDGQILPMPACGQLDPGRAASAGPAALTSWMHGSIAFRFDEPALAGCDPVRLWAGVPQGFRQELTFAWRGERLLAWSWLLGTPDGRTIVPAEIAWDGTGRVAEAEYHCPWNAMGVELYTFAHDRHGRLIQSILDRPARCRGEGEAALRRTTTWRYAGPDDVLPASRAVEDARRGAEDVGPGLARVTVEFEYVHDDAGRLVEVREFSAEGRLEWSRTLRWAGDRVVRQVVRWPVANGNRGVQMAERGFDYTYDRLGRLVERSGDDDVVIRIDYAADGDIERLEASNDEALRNMGYPETSVFDHLGMMDAPASELGRRP